MRDPVNYGAPAPQDSSSRGDATTSLGCDLLT